MKINEFDIARYFEQRALPPLREHALGLVTLLGLIFITFGSIAFNLTMSGDGWSTYLNPVEQGDWVVRIGRWGTRLIYDFTPFHHLNPAAIALFNALSIALAGFLSARIIGLKSRQATFLFASLFVLTPVWAEPYLIFLAQFTLALGLLMAPLFASLALKAIDSSRPAMQRWACAFGASIAFMFTAACYQPLVFFGVIVLGAAFAVRQSEGNAFEGRAFWLRETPIVIGICAAGMFMYWLSIDLFRFLYGLAEPGNARFNPNEIALGLKSIHRLGASLLQFYFLDMHLIPRWLPIISLAGLATWSAPTLLSRDKEKGGAFTVKLAVLALIAAILISPFLITMIREPRISMLLPVAAVIALGLSLPVERIRPGLLNSLFVIVGFFAVFSSAYITSAAFATKLSNFALDMHLGGELVDQVIHDDSIQELSPKAPIHITVIGKVTTRGNEPFELLATDGPIDSSLVNCGVLNCQRGRIDELFKIFGHGSHRVTIRYAGDKQVSRWFKANLDMATRERLAGQWLAPWNLNPGSGLLIGKDGNLLLLLRGVRAPVIAAETGQVND